MSAGVVVLLATSGCSLLLDFSEPDAGQQPADAAADAYIIPQAQCDAYESNESYLTRAFITPGTHQAAICPASDKDYYYFDLEQTSNVTIQVAFIHARGDLVLQVYRDTDFNPELTPVATVDSKDDDEIFSGVLEVAAAEETESYTLQVYSSGGRYENAYELTLTVEPIEEEE